MLNRVSTKPSAPICLTSAMAANPDFYYSKAAQVDDQHAAALLRLDNDKNLYETARWMGMSDEDIIANALAERDEFATARIRKEVK